MLVDAFTHDGKSLQQDLQRVFGGTVLRCRRNVHRDHQFCTHLPCVAHRHRRHQPAVHVIAPVDFHGHKHRWHSAGGAHGSAGVAALKKHCLTAAQIGGHHAQGNAHVFNQAPTHGLVDKAAQGIAAENAATHQGQHPVGDGRLFHAHRRFLQFSAGLAAGIQRRHQTAGRCADHIVRSQTGFFQHRDHAHMRKTFGSPAAQGQPDARRPFAERRRNFRTDRRRSARPSTTGQCSHQNSRKRRCSASPQAAAGI